MTEREQISHLADDVDRLMHRYQIEYDMSAAAIVGVLEMKVWLIHEQVVREFREEKD